MHPPLQMPLCDVSNLVQVPTVVPEAKRALEQGCAVVIGLQTTGEAAADSMGLEPGQSCGSVSTTKQMLWHFVATHFPLKRETQKNGEPRSDCCPSTVTVTRTFLSDHAPCTSVAQAILHDCCTLIRIEVNSDTLTIESSTSDEGCPDVMLMSNSALQARAASKRQMARQRKAPSYRSAWRCRSLFCRYQF